MALCKFPLYLKQAGGIVSCGQCFTCRLNNARKWTFRLMMEALLHDRTFWTTITYNDEFLPVDAYDLRTGTVLGSHPRGTLDPQNIALFIKRVRKALPPGSFRYFLVGEYGEVTLRPHYHVCVFGFGEEILDVLQSKWVDPISKRSLGFVDRQHCGPITKENARYTVGYTLKKLTKSDDSRLEGRYPEFTSHSLGIGLGFAERYAASINNPSGLAHILATGDIPRAVKFDGRMWPLDRYMRDKILDILGCKEVLKLKGQERYAQEMRKLLVRHEIASGNQASPEFALTTEYRNLNGQKILNTEKRARLKMENKKL